MKRLTILLSCALLAISCSKNTTQQTESHKTASPVNTTALRTASEDALSDALSRGALRGRVMVMETASGRLLLDHCVELRDDSLTVIPVKDTAFEPGSLFVPVLLTTLFDDPDIDIDTAMSVRVGQQTYLDGIFRVKDNAQTCLGQDSLPLHTAFASSSAVATCELCDKYYSNNPDSLTARILRIFPLAKTNSTLSPADLYRICTGYGILLSPTDILTFYSAIAMGGIDPVSGRRICTTSTANILKALLCEEVTSGPARIIKTEEYTIAGKTASVPCSVHSSQHTDIFVGVFPADKPRYTCLVTLESSILHANQVAKVFKMVADHLMNIK